MPGDTLVNGLKTIRNLTDKGTVTPDRRERINSIAKAAVIDFTRILAEHEAMRERLAELEEIHGEKGEALTWRSNGEPIAEGADDADRE